MKTGRHQKTSSRSPPLPRSLLLSSRFLARSTPPMPPPITASHFVTGLHLPLEPHLVALPLLSQTTTTNTRNQPAFGLPMHAILRIVDPSPWHFTSPSVIGPPTLSNSSPPTTSPLLLPPPSRLFMGSTDLGSLITLSLPTPCLLPQRELFRGTDLLVEGFGPGAYSGAVITNIAFSHANFQAMLVSLGGVAMHIPTLTSCLNHFKNHHLQVEEAHEAYTTGMQQNVSHRPDGPPQPKICSHSCATRPRPPRPLAAQWCTRCALVQSRHSSHYTSWQNRASASPSGNSRVTLRALVKVWSLPPQLWMVNSLPQVFLSFHATHTLLSALCLRWTRKLWKCCFLPILNRSSGHPLSPTLPVGVSSPPFLCGWPGRARVPSCTWNSPMARGSSTFHSYRTRLPRHSNNVLHPRVPPPSPLSALGLPDPDVNAIEQATRSALLAMPLLQALDYLHTQLLSGLCVAAPPRGLIPRDKMLDPMHRQPNPVACRLTRPREALQQVLSPTFRCWLGKRISPSMTLVSLKCHSVPRANYFTQGQKGPLHAGFQTGNLLQLTFPTQKPYTLKDHSAFAFALYLTSVTHPGRTTEEPNSAFSDRSAAHVTQLSGILLPILLRYHMFTSKADTQKNPVGHLKLHHMLDTDDPTLVDIPELPPLMLDQSFFMPVSAIRSFFQTVTRVPFYRFPKTLGWPTMDETLEPVTPPASPSFSNLHSFLAILPNFFPPSVRALISSYKTDDTHGSSHFYTSEAYAHLQQLNIRPGTSSSSMDMEYTWPVNWDIPDFASILEPLHFMHSLHSTHPNLLPLLRSLGPHFLRSITSALLASNQHFPSLLLATLYGEQSGHTTLCVQGIFGAGKTFSASLLLIVLSTILDVNTLLSAEPNLPLATAIENIDLLLQDASDDVRAQYGRILANHVKVSSKLDMTPLDRQASFKADSPKRCILVTQGSLLRDLCRDHPQLQSFIQSCRVAINDEAQQGGQAGFTVLAGFLSIHCLQILTGDKEQNRSGTGGEPTKEGVLERLALKSVGFLNNTTALFPWEFAKDVGRALRQFQPFTSSLPTVPDVHCLLASLSSCALPPALSPSTVHQAEGMTHSRRYPQPHSPTISPVPRRPLLHPGGNPLPTSPSPRRQQCGIRALWGSTRRSPRVSTLSIQRRRPWSLPYSPGEGVGWERDRNTRQAYLGRGTGKGEVGPSGQKRWFGGCTARTRRWRQKAGRLR